MKQKRILISGGGVAGYTLAYFLLHAGFLPTVVEKAKKNHSDGYSIELVGTGWDIARKMGLLPVLEKHRVEISETIMKNIDGKDLGRIDLTTLYAEPGAEVKAIALDRSNLVQVLYESLKGQVDVRFSTSIVSIVQGNHDIAVTFDDGQTEKFDLLVGADGYRSNVRKLVFGPLKEFSRYLGYFTGAFYLSNDGQFQKNSVMYLQPNLMATALPRENNRLLVNVTYKEEDEERIKVDEKQATIGAHADAHSWFHRELLVKLDEKSPIFLDSVAQIELPSWSKGRVTLIGDAAYCMSALSGQGTSMAMAGAYVLSQELAQNEAYSTAFAAFEKTLRPHIENTQQKARNVATRFVPNSELKIYLLSSIMKVMKVPWVARLARRQFNIQSLFDTGLLIECPATCPEQLPSNA